MGKGSQSKRWRKTAGTMLVSLILLILTLPMPFAQRRTEAAAPAQAINVAATVTALVQLREGIHALLTATATGGRIVATPTPAAAPATPVTAEVVVKIVASGLNVRSGPGTNFGAIARAVSGESYVVEARTANCGWLKIRRGAQTLGWISGSAQYVTLSAPCNSLPVATS